MSIKLRAWDHFNDEMIYSDKFDDLYDFFYDVKRRENGGNKVSLMLASKCNDHNSNPIYEGDIIQFVHGSGMRTGIVECRPEHFCYWQVKVPGDHFGFGWVMNCCFGIRVTGNRHTDREWLEDEGLGSLLDEASREMNRIDREFKADDCEPPSIKTATLNQNTLAVDHGQADELMRIFGFKRGDFKKEEICADEPGVPVSRVEALRIAGKTLEKAEEERLVKPARTESDYRDDFGQTIKEGDILAFTLCGRRFTGEVLKIFSPEAAKSSWQVWTYESPKLKLSLLHMCEDVACSKVRVIGHISTVRQGGVAVQDIGIQI